MQQTPTYKIVVAKYNENTDWCKFINSDNLVIYDKSNNPVPGSISRRNIGRESDTFIRYILDNYDNLPEYIIFLQGNPFDHFDYKNISANTLEHNIQNLILNNTDTAPLFSNLYSESIKVYKGMNISEYYRFLFNRPSPETITFSRGCQYIIPKHRILQNSKSFYEMLSSMLLKCNYTFHDVHYIQNKFDENVIDPWTFERMAFTMFLNPNQ